jgi:hypothetical protein
VTGVRGAAANLDDLDRPQETSPDAIGLAVAQFERDLS